MPRPKLPAEQLQSAEFRFKVTPALRERGERIAGRQHLTLSAWARAVVVDAIERESTRRQPSATALRDIVSEILHEELTTGAAR